LVRLKWLSVGLFAQVPRLAVSFETAPVAAGAGRSAPFALPGHCVKFW
jgi:hypothetical protein